MSSESEQVAQFRAKAAKLKEEYKQRVIAYQASVQANADPEVQKKGLADVHGKALAYFNAYEQFVADSNLIGAQAKGRWVINLAEDCYSVLETVQKHYGFMARESTRLAIDPATYHASGLAYASMERMVKQYLSRKVARKLEENFRRAGLPLYGFENPDMPDDKTNADGKLTPQVILAVALGTIFLLLLLLIAVAIPNPTVPQMFIFRVVLTVSAAAFGAVIPGFLSVEGRILLAIRAGGAFALAVIVYFINPPSLVVQNAPAPAKAFAPSVPAAPAPEPAKDAEK